MEYVVKFEEWPSEDQFIWFLKDKVRRPCGTRTQNGKTFVEMERIETLPKTILQIVRQEIQNF